MPKPEIMDKLIVLNRILKGLRLDLGLTQGELAERIGHPQSFVSDYERSCRRLDLAQLEVVSKVLGLSLIELVQRYSSEV